MPAVYPYKFNHYPAEERILMKRVRERLVFASLVLAMICAGIVHASGQATAIPSARLIQPEDLVKLLQSHVMEMPLLIQVGSHVLYSQAHIPGSEYIGPASNPAGLEQLRKRVEPLPRTKSIVLYCGCCPWTHCPTVKPADDALHAMGFRNVKVLYLPNNFGADWVQKGYPTAKGD